MTVAVMRPGPELDALVAQRVLGLKTCADVNCSGGCDSPGGYLMAEGWEGTTPYSTDSTTCIAAAEEARKAGKITLWQIQANEDAYVAECFIHGLGYGADGETPAHALALALLKAVGHE